MYGDIIVALEKSPVSVVSMAALYSTLIIIPCVCCVRVVCVCCVCVCVVCVRVYVCHVTTT